MNDYLKAHELKTGDQVVLVRYDSFGGLASAQVSKFYTVTKVLKTRVVVTAVEEDYRGVKDERRFIVDKYGRLDREEGGSKYGGSHILTTDTDRYAEILAAKVRRTALGEARAATADWMDSNHGDDAAALDRAIAALQELSREHFQK